MNFQKENFTDIDCKLLIISSSAFENGKLIPRQFTCDGSNISPPLDIDHLPEDAKSLAVIVEDPDAPIRIWVHWLVWNITPTNHLKENEVHGTEGMNDFQQHQYGGPCPPDGTHRYFFKVYALDTLLYLSVSAKKAELEKAMAGHIIAFGELIGLYERNKNHK